MKNIRKIVDKYDGMIKCFVDGHMFCCDILLRRGNMESVNSSKAHYESVNSTNNV